MSGSTPEVPDELAETVLWYEARRGNGVRVGPLRDRRPRLSPQSGGVRGTWRRT